jgi:anaerobic nitric oxide reductase transcription regulator
LGPVRISPDAYEAMMHYDWPGNVRELENIISRAVLKASFDFPKGDQVVMSSSHLGGDLMTAEPKNSPQFPKKENCLYKGSFNDEVKDFKRNMIRHALSRNNGNWAAAARDLNMHRSNLHNLAKRLGLKA